MFLDIPGRILGRCIVSILEGVLPLEWRWKKTASQTKELFLSIDQEWSSHFPSGKYQTGNFWLEGLKVQANRLVAFQRANGHDVNISRSYYPSVITGAFRGKPHIYWWDRLERRWGSRVVQMPWAFHTHGRLVGGCAIDLWPSTADFWTLSLIFHFQTSKTRMQIYNAPIKHVRSPCFLHGENAAAHLGSGGNCFK